MRGDAPSHNDPRPYASLRAPDCDGDLGGCHAEDFGPEDAAHWQVMVKVPDADAIRAEVAAAGGAVVTGPLDAGNGRIAAIATPTGTIITIGQDKDYVPAGHRALQGPA